jgi:translation initiation factor 2B subunit (eIF-2B alpha/beta/delta family)
MCFQHMHVVIVCCLQVGEEEKEPSELLPAWGQDLAAAISKMAAPTAARGGQQAQPQQQQQVQVQQQQHARGQAGAVGSSRSSAVGADASALAPGGSIELRNVYFEAVPLSLVSAVITDKGVLSQVQVAALMQARAKGYEQAFGLGLPDDLLPA